MTKPDLSAPIITNAGAWISTLVSLAQKARLSIERGNHSDLGKLVRTAGDLIRTNCRHFADGELARDVLEQRWAALVEPAEEKREKGTIFGDAIDEYRQRIRAEGTA